jgi:excisionase family DNA binding protein
MWSTVVVARPIKLSNRQVAVLRWIGGGCPRRDWPDESHKNTARALASRGLAEVGRKKKVWTATITSAGEYYLEHGRPEPRRKADLKTSGGAVRDAPRLARGQRRTAHPGLDATSGAMRRVAARRRPTVVRQSQREIKEMFMRYKVVVTRVQVAERFVRATSEEDAAEKVQAEFDRPYGYFGSWKTTTSEIDVVEAEQTTVIGPTHLSNEGPMLLGLKDAAKALGISYSTLYQMTGQGDIEWVSIGNRKYISRETLLEFITANTHRGYYLTR